MNNRLSMILKNYGDRGGCNFFNIYMLLHLHVFLFQLEFAVRLPLPPQNIFVITWVHIEN